MTLWILRHGIAEATGPRGRDDLRRLTALGRARLRRAVAGLVFLDVAPGVIFTSPLPRAAETATIVAAGLPGHVVPQEMEALAPGASPPDMLRALRTATRQQRLMLVGHEPGLSALAALLLTGSVDGARLRLKKGGCLALTLDRLFPPSGACLEWHLTPKQLRRLAG